MEEAADESITPGARKRPLGSELIIPVISGAFALYFLWDTWGSVWESRVNGILIIVPLFALIVVKAVSILRGVYAGWATLGFGELVVWNAVEVRRWLLFSVFILLASVIEWLGLTLSLFLALLVSLWILEVRSWKILAFVPALTSLFVYGLFIALLQKRMPLGPLDEFLNQLIGKGGI